MDVARKSRVVPEEKKRYNKNSVGDAGRGLLPGKEGLMAYREEWLDGARDDLTQAFAVRLEVFCEEQGYSPSVELDEQDRAAWHIVLWDGEEAAGTGRLYWKNEGVAGLGRIAVRRPWRGRGIGRMLLAAMEKQARALGARQLELDAQCRAIGFYERSGFTVCGEEHMDGHVPHKMMRKIL